MYLIPAPTLDSVFRPFVAATRELIVEEDISSLVNTNRSEKYRDRIVVIKPVAKVLNGTFFSWLVNASQTAHTIVVPYGLWDNFLGYPSYVAPLSFSGVMCTVLTISTPSFASLAHLAPNETVVLGTLESDDGYSPLHLYFHSGAWLVLTIFMSGTSIACCVIAAVRLVQYWRGVRSLRPMIATTCLWLEFCSGFIRFLYWSLDPFGSREIIPNVAAQSVFRTATFPFFICSTILLTFYWYESLTTTSLKINLNVSKFRIPAYIMCAICVIFELLSWIYNLGDLSASVFKGLNQAYYILVSIGMAIFYVITAIRILLALRRFANSSNAPSVSGTESADDGSGPRKVDKETKKKQKKEKKANAASLAMQRRANRQLKATTVKLTISGAALVVLVFLSFLSVATFYADSAVAHPGYLAWWCLLHTMLNIKGITTCLAFNPPRPTRFTSKTGSSSKTTNTASLKEPDVESPSASPKQAQRQVSLELQNEQGDVV